MPISPLSPTRIEGIKSPQTITEKILARHVLTTESTGTALTAGNGVFVRADLRFIHDIYAAMCAHSLHETCGRPLALHEPETILTFEDHYSYAHQSVMHVKNGLLPNVRALSEGTALLCATMGLRITAICPEVKARKVTTAARKAFRTH